PKVASSVVQFLPLPAPRYPATWDAMETVVAAAFGQRRKMLRGALRSLGADTDRLLQTAAIDPEARAETLSVEQFAALARAYASPT
ncbi:MAG: 16S rRNA (adenine(1518)-N(6)/adenine(1519)-N(6))-dimethyltransferase, partial [Alphaproteobacteria bacterium]